MRIAIISTGLACAHEFERLGISPILLEKYSDIREQVDNYFKSSFFFPLETNLSTSLRLYFFPSI